MTEYERTKSAPYWEMQIRKGPEEWIKSEEEFISYYQSLDNIKCDYTDCNYKACYLYECGKECYGQHCKRKNLCLNHFVLKVRHDHDIYNYTPDCENLLRVPKVRIKDYVYYCLDCCEEGREILELMEKEQEGYFWKIECGNEIDDMEF